MRRAIRWGVVAAFLLVQGAVVGCSSSSPTDDVTAGELPADVPSDIPLEVPADVVAEVPADVVAEVPADVVAEVPADALAEVPADVPAEVPADVPAEVASDVPATEVPGDLPVEVPADVASEASPDAPADAASETGDDPCTDCSDVPPVGDVVADADAVADAPDADPMPDVAWDTLPTLPAGKTFTGKYAAGTGQKDVSPVQPTHLGGFGFCMGDETLCRSTDGVHDPLLASAVALADSGTGDVVMFIGVDTIGLLRSDIEDMHNRIQVRLYEEFGVFFQGNRALISASHAHSSCDTVGLWGPGFGAGREDAYVELLKAGVVEAARDAYASLQDVTLDWGAGTWENSTDDAFTTDSDLFVLRGKGADAKTVFTLVRYNAHPTTYGDKMLSASADWVGTMRKKLQDDLGGVNVLMAGPMGSVYPARPDTCGLEVEAFPDGDRSQHPEMDAADYMKATCTGYGIAGVALTALATSKPVTDTGVTFRTGRFDFHPTNESLMILAEYGPLPYEWVDVDDPTAMMHSIFAVVQVGDLTYITTPGESFPSFAKKAKDIATEAGLANPIVLGLTQDWMGYLLLEGQWKDKKLSYHQSLSPGPTVEPTYMAALRALLGLPAAPVTVR